MILCADKTVYQNKNQVFLWTCKMFMHSQDIFFLQVQDTEVFFNFLNIIIQVTSSYVSMSAYAPIRLCLSLLQIKLPQYISSVGQSTREIKRSSCLSSVYFINHTASDSP